MVQTYYTNVGGELRLDVLGHGNLANIEGLDVMCAAVTSLTNTLALNVQSAAEAKLLDEEPMIYIGDDEEGKARVLCKPCPEHFSILKTIFATVCNGLLMLSKLYPDYVEFVSE